MASSPPDRDHAGFTVVRHGFDRAQVKHYIQRLETEAAAAAGERDEVRAKVDELAGQLQIAQREIDALTDRLGKLSTSAVASAAPNAPERAARAIATAESEAGEITARAQAAAETAWADAEAVSRELRDRYRGLLADLDSQHAEAHAAHKAVITEAKAKAEVMTTAANKRQRAIDEEAERARQRTEQQFQEEMSRRRAELATEIDTARTAAETEAARLVKEATDEAAKRIATATSHIERLTALREQLAGRLRGTSDLLTQSAGLLEPLEAESELDQLPPPEASTTKLQPVRTPAGAPTA
ncbi:DivIVA domain-containing protein [Actinokineospora auranticolor]|uniref:DivIVA protein n=1 Tax=Actinokineospora auranticolor TaxID=155976 RepID=A0A2S6GYH8_9PSEU|nr:DivIVA domain-containing protein [Actinokineospora auranticolor]PPK70289.1 DivIVA protein [Actinokineospora auranticolor]